MKTEEKAYQPECENKPPQQKTAAADSLRRTAMQGGDAARERNSQKHTTLHSWLAQANL